MRWREVPLRSLYRRVEVYGRPDLPLLSVYRDHGVVPRSDRNDNHNKPSADLSSYKIVRRQDLVINKMKTWQGSLAISALDGIVSPAYFVGHRIGNVDDRFMHHLLRSPPLIAEYGARSKGIRPSQWDLSWDEFASIKVHLPSLEEQRAISDYLDIETARIDSLISKKHRLIGLLEERDQSIVDDWFGSFDSVQYVRIGHLAEVRSGVTLGGKRTPVAEEVAVPYLRVANVKHDRLDLTDVKTLTLDPATAKRTALQSGDVLMTEGGDIDKLGRGTVWRGEIDLCLHQNHVFAIRIRTQDLVPEFLAMVTRTSYARRYFEMTGVRSTNLASTSSSKVADFRVPLPDPTEQMRLVRKYQQAWESFEKARATIGRQMDLFNERKRALITAVVTGEQETKAAVRSL